MTATWVFFHIHASSANRQCPGSLPKLPRERSDPSLPLAKHRPQLQKQKDRRELSVQAELPLTGRNRKSLGPAYVCPFSDESQLAVLYKAKYKYRQQTMHLIHIVLFWYPNSPRKGKGSCGPPAFQQGGAGTSGWLMGLWGDGGGVVG